MLPTGYSAAAVQGSSRGKQSTSTTFVDVVPASSQSRSTSAGSSRTPRSTGQDIAVQPPKLAIDEIAYVFSPPGLDCCVLDDLPTSYEAAACLDNYMEAPPGLESYWSKAATPPGLDGGVTMPPPGINKNSQAPQSGNSLRSRLQAHGNCVLHQMAAFDQVAYAAPPFSMPVTPPQAVALAAPLPPFLTTTPTPVLRADAEEFVPAPITMSRDAEAPTEEVREVETSPSATSAAGTSVPIKARRWASKSATQTVFTPSAPGPEVCLQSEISEEPALDTEEVPTVGSSLHSQGTCKPCAFLYTKGCENGTSCTFCHLCNPGEKKRRRAERSRRARQ